MSNIQSVIKNIQDIMRKDAGVDRLAQAIGETWLLTWLIADFLIAQMIAFWREKEENEGTARNLFNTMDELEPLKQKIRQFIIDRDWDQFRNPKDIALSLTLEAAEVLEHFQWKKPEEVEAYLAAHREEFGEEVADVFIYLIQLADKAGVDLLQAANDKIGKNEAKYPIDKSKGKATKYNKL